MGSYGLRNQQNRVAEAADGTQYGVGVGSHHFESSELLLVVIDHASLAFGSRL